MTQFTHIINPFAVPSGSEHDIAQRVSFASLRNSVAYAEEHGVSVEVLAVCYPEDAPAVEAPARLLPPLERSVQDIRAIKPVRKFPLLVDILEAGARHGVGEYLVFTNIDISTQPHFYVEVQKILTSGEYAPRACLINRRLISSHYTSVSELPAMYADTGFPHPGYDCFVFPRAWVQDLCLERVCIGTRHFDYLLIANLDLLSNHRLMIYRDICLTFHIGNDETWWTRIEYDNYNVEETIRAIQAMLAKYPAPRECTHFHDMVSYYRRESTLRLRLRRQLRHSRTLRRVAKHLRGGY